MYCKCFIPCHFVQITKLAFFLTFFLPFSSLIVLNQIFFFLLLVVVSSVILKEPKQFLIKKAPVLKTWFPPSKRTFIFPLVVEIKQNWELWADTHLSKSPKKVGFESVPNFSPGVPFWKIMSGRKAKLDFSSRRWRNPQFFIISIPFASRFIAHFFVPQFQALQSLFSPRLGRHWYHNNANFIARKEPKKSFLCIDWPGKLFFLFFSLKWLLACCRATVKSDFFFRLH